MESLNIILAVDTHEAEEFSYWLKNNGHSASIGNSTASYVNGASSFGDPEAREIMQQLWDEYCNE